MRVMKKERLNSMTGFEKVLRSHAGFTLVEVLIAAMILFSALTVGTMAYRTSVLALEKTTSHAVISGALPDIMAEIKSRLMEQVDKGEGQYGAKINYTWRTEKAQSVGNVMGLSELGQSVAYGSFQISLQDVTLNLAYEFERVKKEEAYAYKELVWHK